MSDNNLGETVTQYRDMLGGFEPWQVRGVALIHDGNSAVVVAYIDTDEVSVFNRIPANVLTYVLESRDIHSASDFSAITNKAQTLKDHCTAHRRLLGYPETTFMHPRLSDD